jgi:periplasmic protein TonB
MVDLWSDSTSDSTMGIWENPQPKRFSRGAIAASVCLHVVVLAALMYKPIPPLLKQTSSLKGDGGRGRQSITLIAPGANVPLSPIRTNEPLAEKKVHAPRPRPKKELAAIPEPKPLPASSDSLKPGMPGYVLGSLTTGFASNHDVRIALPVHAPDPPIVRAKLPDWIRGDVVVEVTIDEQGHVVNTVVLQTVGYGLEDTVVATLREWKWVPATVDGTKVASRQDVRFHFPS